MTSAKTQGLSRGTSRLKPLAGVGAGALQALRSRIGLWCVAERELRAAARNPRLHRIRQVIAMAVVLLSGCLLWVFDRWGGLIFTSKDMFRSLSWAAFVLCLLGGCTATCDALSREKRQGTIGLLFLTHLRSMDIVFGKFLASALSSFYALLTAMPIFGICMVMGGVGLGEFARTCLNLANTLFFSSSVGLCVSSLSLNQTRASSAASALVLGFGAGLPALAEYALGNVLLPIEAAALQWFSPFYAQHMAQWDLPGPRQHDFWIATGLIHGIAWAFLALASVFLARHWREPVPDAKRSQFGWRERLAALAQGGLASRNALRRKRLDLNPYYWLGSRNGLGALDLWITLVLGALLAGYVSWRYRGFVPLGELCLFAAVGLSLMTKVSVASFSPRRLAEDKQSGALELLLVTPLGITQIVRGQWLAIGARYAGPVSLVLLMFCVMLWALLTFDPGGARLRESWALVTGFLLTFFTDLVALVWVGLWMGLRLPQAPHAPAAAFWRIVILPWVLTIPCVTLYELKLRAIVPMRVSMPLLLFGLSALNALCFALWARRRLYGDFRAVVADRFQDRFQ